MYDTYEYCAKIDQNGDSAGKKKSEEASGKKNEGDSSGKPSLNFTETFKLHFQGLRFTVGDGYFVHSKGRNSRFERHISSRTLVYARTENGLWDKYL